jgi:hypothetical protein
MCDLQVVMKADRTSDFGIDSPYTFLLTHIAGPDLRPATATPSVHSTSLDEHVDI